MVDAILATGDVGFVVHGHSQYYYSRGLRASSLLDVVTLECLEYCQQNSIPPGLEFEVTALSGVYALS